MLTPLLIAATLLAGVVAGRQDTAAPQNWGSVRYVPADLSAAFNNKGVASNASQVSNATSFDGRSGSFASEGFFTGLKQIYNIPYMFRGQYGDGADDNVRCDGQNVAVPPGRYYSMKVMAAADPDSSKSEAQTPGTFTFHYSDGTTHSLDASAPQWTR